eukprot:218999-Rhodomonas_salina.1
MALVEAGADKEAEDKVRNGRVHNEGSGVGAGREGRRKRRVDGFGGGGCGGGTSAGRSRRAGM